DNCLIGLSATNPSLQGASMKLNRESLIEGVITVLNHEVVAIAATIVLLTLFGEYAHAQCVPSYAVVAAFVALYWVCEIPARRKESEKKWDWKTQRRVYTFWTIDFPNMSPDTEKAKQKAKEGDAHSQYVLAHRYFYGSGGMKQDYKEAVKWARLSAERGYPDGQFLYSMCLGAGDGTEMDDIAAKQWRFVAATGGHHVAQLTIGMASVFGDITEGSLLNGSCSQLNQQMRSLRIPPPNTSSKSDQPFPLKK
ncbi:MAG TPA: tetratricopeptide repeat protein, partial [Bryobacteraceae bacterium]|nr:tetratricopeptide repeat protein [Bryobacteraceae bacterium]